MWASIRPDEAGAHWTESSQRISTILNRARAADLARAGVDPAALDAGIRQIVELRVAQMAGEVVGALTGTPLRSGAAFWR